MREPEDLAEVAPQGIQRSGKAASAPQGGARQVPIQVQSVRVEIII